MTVREIIREEHGPPNQRGRISHVKDGAGNTLRVVRDAAGRVVGLEGRSETDGLTERLEGLEGDAGELAERVRALEATPAPTVEAVERCAEVVERVEARIGTSARAAQRCSTAAASVEDQAAELAVRARELEEAAWRIEGWQRHGHLRLHPGRVAQAAERLGVSWPVRVRWMDRTDEAARDRRHGGLTGGYCGPWDSEAHTITLRQGRGPEDTAATIRHELAHCSQVERMRDKFEPVYLDPDGREALEAEADEMAAEVAD